MKISEIKDEKLRELALQRREESNWKDLSYNDSYDLSWAFDWSKTPEGVDFWYKVNFGKITSLDNHPQYATPKKPAFKIKHRFAIDELIEFVESTCYAVRLEGAKIDLEDGNPDLIEKCKEKIKKFEALSDLLTQIKKEATK